MPLSVVRVPTSVIRGTNIGDSAANIGDSGATIGNSVAPFSGCLFALLEGSDTYPYMYVPSLRVSVMA